MMGRQSAQDQLFYSFRLEDHIPGDHLLRELDQVLNFDRVRSVLSGHYSSTGRPSRGSSHIQPKTSVKDFNLASFSGKSGSTPCFLPDRQT